MPVVFKLNRITDNLLPFSFPSNSNVSTILVSDDFRSQQSQLIPHPPFHGQGLQISRGRAVRFSRALTRTFYKLLFSVRVLPTIVPLGTNQVSAYVGFLRSFQRTSKTNSTEAHHTSPKDGRYPLTQRGSATLTLNRRRGSHLSRRLRLPSLEFQTR